jgi:O-antigen/teichoic acid export membrane protein
VRLSLLFLGGLGLVFGLTIFLGAPLLVHLVLGPAFKNSVPVLRVFSLWIPLIALCTVMIFQLLLPNHLDKQFNFVNLTAALLGIVSTLLLAPRYRALGVAWSAVAVQLYTLLAFCLVAWRAGLNPFARATDASGRNAPRSAALGRAGEPRCDQS